MLNSNVICTIVIFCFGFIQAIEISSFFARYSGIYLGKKTLAYTLQNAVFMLTRFFTMALLPLLGILIDIGIDKNTYLEMVIKAYFLTGVLGVSIIYMRDKIIFAFTKVLEEVNSGSSLLTSLLKFPKFFMNSPYHERFGLPTLKYLFSSKVFWLSAIVFAIYALSVFSVFFVSLSFPAYRASISQLSGVTNAAATVLLTFIIEPKISLSIDKNNNIEALDLIFSLIIGRVIGVCLICEIFMISLWLFI